MTNNSKSIVSKSDTKIQEPQIDESRLMDCAICFEQIPPIPQIDWYEGQNADPVIPEGRCCSRCDNEVVIPVRGLIFAVEDLDREVEEHDPFHQKSTRAEIRMMIDFKLSQLRPDTFDEVFKNRGYDEKYKREFKKYSKKAKAFGLGG